MMGNTKSFSEAATDVKEEEEEEEEEEVVNENYALLREQTHKLKNRLCDLTLKLKKGNAQSDADRQKYLDKVAFLASLSEFVTVDEAKVQAFHAGFRQSDAKFQETKKHLEAQIKAQTDELHAVTDKFHAVSCCIDMVDPDSQDYAGRCNDPVVQGFRFCKIHLRLDSTSKVSICQYDWQGEPACDLPTLADDKPYCRDHADLLEPRRESLYGQKRRGVI